VIRAAVRGVGELLITLGLFLLLFVSWQLWWTDVEADQDRQAITQSLRHEWTTSPDPRPHAVQIDYGDPPDLTAPAEGEAFGVVHIPRFGADYAVPVNEGVGLAKVLNHGVLGHYPGTAMPGEVGNFAMAGHRTTYGKPMNQIAELQVGDAVVVETADAWYTYRVSGTEVVTPDRVDVVAAVPGQPDAEPTERMLTLTACHPMYSARQRYIVHAVMDSWQPRDAGAPQALAAG
jgi:sortase A